MIDQSTTPADSTVRWVVAAILALVLIPVGVFIADQVLGGDLDVVMRDTSAAAGAPYYYGYVSTLGIFIWGAAAGASGCAYVALRGHAPVTDTRFFGTSFLLTALLGLDDGLLWHEEAFPAHGVPEPVVYVVYLLAALTWLVMNLAHIGRSHRVVLLGALGCFAVSVLLDFYERVFSPLAVQVIVEDGFKFVGIGLWAIYLVIAGRDRLRVSRAEERQLPASAT